MNELFDACCKRNTQSPNNMVFIDVLTRLEYGRFDRIKSERIRKECMIKVLVLRSIGTHLLTINKATASRKQNVSISTIVPADSLGNGFNRRVQDASHLFTN